MIKPVSAMIKLGNKRKILVEFLEKNVVNRWVDEFVEIDKRYRKDMSVIEEELKSKFNSICKLCAELQEQGAKGEIKYIYFSLLRTSFLKNRWMWRIDLYDENWFFDKAECSINISLDFIYDSFFQNVDELKEKKKQYGKSITDMDIEDVMLEEADKYHIVAVEFLKVIIEKLIEVPFYEKMIKSEEINIMAGEYMDASEIIYPKQHVN